jgi:uncharacterized protein (DUF2249 family)
MLAYNVWIGVSARGRVISWLVVGVLYVVQAKFKLDYLRRQPYVRRIRQWRRACYASHHSRCCAHGILRTGRIFGFGLQDAVPPSPELWRVNVGRAYTRVRTAKRCAVILVLVRSAALRHQQLCRRCT